MLQISEEVLAIDPESNTSDPLAPQIPKEMPTDGEVGGDGSDIVIDESEDGKSVTLEIPDIIIAGQLGKLITSELNKAFKVDQEELPDISEVKIVVDDKTKKSTEGFIYATDMKSLNEEGTFGLLDNLSTALEKYPNILCYIEPNGKIPNGLGLMEEFFKENKIRVSHSLESLKINIEETFLNG